MQHHIFNLEISMHSINAVKTFEPVDYLKEIFDGQVFWDGFLALQQLSQIATITVLKY